MLVKNNPILKAIVTIVAIHFVHLQSLTTSFEYGKDIIRGVNLGSWLVLERWITPSLFYGLPETVQDEYHMCKQLGYEEAKRRLIKHWETWVTEKDFIELKNAGINHVRIPVGYWAFELLPHDPYVQGSFKYLQKGCEWARKYGLRVLIDLHGVPKSQNGWPHIGNGVGGIGFFDDMTNLEIGAQIIGKIAKLFSTPEWKDTVTIIEPVNEPFVNGGNGNAALRLSRLKLYYEMSFKEIRKYNKDVYVAFHDAFIGLDVWEYLSTDPAFDSRIMLDTRLYAIYTWDVWDLTCEEHTSYSCQVWDKLPQSNKRILTVMGEWSLATPYNCQKEIVERAKTQISVYERGSGWFFWNFKHQEHEVEWDFLECVNLGWINLHADNNVTCTTDR